MNKENFLGFIHLDEFRRYCGTNARMNRDAADFPIDMISSVGEFNVYLRDGSKFKLYPGESAKIQEILKDITFNCSNVPVW